MEAKSIKNLAAAIILMALMITGNSQHPYSDCFHKCSGGCFTKLFDKKCLINCDLKCHGYALQQFSKHCKDSCLQIHCSKCKDGIKKLICESTCKTFCHAWD